MMPVYGWEANPVLPFWFWFFWSIVYVGITFFSCFFWVVFGGSFFRVFHIFTAPVCIVGFAPCLGCSCLVCASLHPSVINKICRLKNKRP